MPWKCRRKQVPAWLLSLPTRIFSALALGSDSGSYYDAFMRFGLNKSIRRDLITSVLLATLVLRALVPTGFMPSADQPFAMQMCGVGFHGHFIGFQDGNTHPGKRSQFDHCPFGSAPVTGPLSQLATLLPSWQSIDQPLVTIEPPRLAMRFNHVHQPRAPPRLV